MKGRGRKTENTKNRCLQILIVQKRYIRTLNQCLLLFFSSLFKFLFVLLVIYVMTLFAFPEKNLGPEFGGAIGALFFFANIVSSALYITGCVEGILDNFGKNEETDGVLPIGRWWIFLYCTVINFINVCICLIGASLFAKTSVLVLGIVGKMSK